MPMNVCIQGPSRFILEKKIHKEKKYIYISAKLSMDAFSTILAIAGRLGKT